MFTVKSLKIYKECQYRKNLKEGTFYFEDCSIDDFFGKNITLHTIVGKNGSGKSSLLDVIFRIINNVGALMCKDVQVFYKQPVKYVRHIHADLSYEIISDGEIESHKAKLCVRDTALWLVFDNIIYWLSDNDLCELWPQKNQELQNLEREYGKNHIIDFSDLSSDDKKRELASMMFFTIATNYSILGFQASEYTNEESMAYEESQLLFDDGDLILCEDGDPLVYSSWTPSKNWLNGIFHKNDGYLCPIVLNPYRDQGIINMNAEASLTQNRWAALLLSGILKDDLLIEDYYLDHVDYELKEDFYLKFKPIFSKEDKKHENNLLKDFGDLKIFKDVSLIKGSRVWNILDELHCQSSKNMTNIEIFARMYLVYKILNIAATYPHYEKYKDISDINSIFLRGVKSSSKYRSLVQEVLSRTTHTEQKVHQTLHFIRLLDIKKLKDGINNSEWLESSFGWDRYRDYFDLPRQYKNVEELMNILPPNIFKQQIFLKRKLANGQWDKNIPFMHLSSGQKQLLYQLSSIIYHLMNLKSIPQNEPHYNNINIVLDEIEVCFHPEYQRKFISKLLDLVVHTLRLNEMFSIHFWLTTHSPFILSDIPQNLITYMEDGSQLTEDEIKMREILSPTAANISEILHQSFFLENGFIGEFVRQKILSLVRYLQSEQRENNEWNMKKAKDFMTYIEEPFISLQLENLYKSKK